MSECLRLIIMDVARRACVLLALLTIGCGRTPPPTPSPGPGTGETITGRERLGWDQPATSTAELATFRYAIYVDGARSEIADVNCGATAGAGGFACSGRLPAMSNGSHTLELAAFFDAGGIVESPKSAPLRVTVTATAAPASATPLQSRDTVTTADGVRLHTALVASGLDDVVDFALMPDGRLVVAERAGRIRVVAAGGMTDALRADPGDPGADGGILALTLDPDVLRTGHVFVTHTPPGAFRVVRYRFAGSALVERMALMRDVPASADPSAALRAGPDGKIYAAFDDGGDRDAAARLSEWSGKILRLNGDGGTPDDQPAASPVFWSGLRAPRGLGWSPDTGTLWLAEQGREGLERVTALVTGPGRPRRAAQRASHALPRPLGARALAFYRGEAIPEFRGDMFIAASEAGYLLRVRFDPSDALRATSSERLLDGRIGPVRAVAVSADGALFVAGESAIWRLARPR
jgi:glucose/arabinose dehydrogenase